MSGYMKTNKEQPMGTFWKSNCLVRFCKLTPRYRQVCSLLQVAEMLDKVTSTGALGHGDS